MLLPTRVVGWGQRILGVDPSHLGVTAKYLKVETWLEIVDVATWLAPFNTSKMV